MKADIIVKSIIFNRNINKLLILQRSKGDDIGAGTWENAGGNMEYGETPEEAIKREIKEEAGITDIIIERVAYVSMFSPTKLIIVYLCEALTEAVVLSSEHQAYMWAAKNDCIKLLPPPIVNDFEKNGIFEYIGI